MSIKYHRNTIKSCIWICIALFSSTLSAAPPVSVPGGPYAGIAGEEIYLDGRGSYDIDGNVERYIWVYGDGEKKSHIRGNISHIYTDPGSYSAKLMVIDNDGESDNAWVDVNVTAAPISDPGGPYSGTAGEAVQLDGSGSYDPDGSITRYIWDFGDGTTDVGVRNDRPLHTYAAPGLYTITLTVRDDSTAIARVSSITSANIGVNDNPHVSITVYEGPQTCLECHESEAVEMHGSVHYQQSGQAINLTNDVSSPSNPDGLAGERGPGAIGINTYCGTHENSPRFTCAGCHVGNGRFPKAVLPATEPERSEELANIDCLMCHQENYKRYPTGPFEPLEIVAVGADDGLPDPSLPPIVRDGYMGIPVVDPVTLDFQFEPADENSPIGLAGFPLMNNRVLAAQSVHPTTREACLNCHAGAGGGDGTKRGDMSSALQHPTADIDIHMNATGNDLTCSDCHNAGGHRLRGRGLDLRPNDVPERFTCESCHGSTPHGDYSSRNGQARDTHAGRVACQTCHIPTYAKGGVPTEVSRDWTQPHYSDAACNGRGGWLPEEIKVGDLVPTYQWFNGTSQVYVLGEDLSDYPTTTLDDGSPAYTLGVPNGDISDPEARIYPMKEHTSISGRHIASNQIIGHSTYEFFRTGDFYAAVESGLEQTGRSGEAYDLVNIHTFQTINHGVEASTEALDCGSCHNSLAGGPLRMDLKNDLGYQLKAGSFVVCTQCHGNEPSRGFTWMHDKHVNEERYDCSWCHTFARPGRNLR